MPLLVKVVRIAIPPLLGGRQAFFRSLLSQLRSLECFLGFSHFFLVVTQVILLDLYFFLCIAEPVFSISHLFISLIGLPLQI